MIHGVFSVGSTACRWPIFYHRGWFALMIATLLLVLSRPASSEKSSLLLSYFLLWTLFGPIVHCLLPAGGPIFFEHLGYGDRFAGIQRPHDMVLMSDYLWTSYATGGFGPGSGISAMPSLHIATTAWMVIAVRVHAPRMTWVISGFRPADLPAVDLARLALCPGWPGRGGRRFGLLPAFPPLLRAAAAPMSQLVSRSARKPEST